MVVTLSVVPKDIVLAGVYISQAVGPLLYIIITFVISDTDFD